MGRKRRDPTEAWSAYMGQVGKGRWAPPQSRAQLYGLLNRVGMLWYRIRRDRLYFPPLLSVLKQIADNLLQETHLSDAVIIHKAKATGKKAFIAHEAYYNLCAEIIAWRPTQEFFEGHLEIRIHEEGVCSICSINLKWPAYIVFARGARSSQIGVQCLEHIIAKMEVYLKSLQSVLNWDKNGRKL